MSKSNKHKIDDYYDDGKVTKKDINRRNQKRQNKKLKTALKKLDLDQIIEIED